MSAAPRRPSLALPVALAIGPGACLPAFAADGAVVALAGAVGIALGVAVALAVCWQVLRERVAPRSEWTPYALTAGVLALLALAVGGRFPLYLLVVSVLVAAWGLALVHGLSGRMHRLLAERDRARAEANQAKQDSERDPLTGALNRGAWRARLERLGQDTQQDQRPLSVLFFDIDLFKLINDSLGHQVGDDCLKAVSATVAHELRGGDILGRLGGEEFGVALPGARRIHAIAVGERIRMAVQERCRTVGEEVVEITVSIGAAEYLGPDEGFDALLDRADRAMYTAKGSGRNMVVADAATPSAG